MSNEHWTFSKSAMLKVNNYFFISSNIVPYKKGNRMHLIFNMNHSIARNKVGRSQTYLDPPRSK